MAVNVKSKPVTNIVSFGGYGASGIARNVEIRDESPPNCDEMDICKFLSDIDLNVDQPFLKKGISKTVVKNGDDSTISLSSLLNEEVFSLLEEASDGKSGDHWAMPSKTCTMPPFENCEITLSCLAENHLKSEKTDIVLPKTDDLDDGLLPDIDLNFCIKRPDSNAKLLSLGSSPNTSDSGFDEAILDVTATFKDLLTFKAELCPEKEFTSVLTNPKPTLLSKSLSCKVKLDKSKSEKVKNIRRELIKNHFRTKTFLHKEVQPEEKLTKVVEDRSNHPIFNINSRFSVPSH